jgi:hypothetical protein
VFNYFDPDSIPEVLAPYAEATFEVVQSLAQVGVRITFLSYLYFVLNPSIAIVLNPTLLCIKPTPTPHNHQLNPSLHPQLHGFQVDNSRNQAEHLLMLLFNETQVGLLLYVYVLLY